MVSGGVWGVSGGCLVSVLGLLVVSGGCWVVSGGCFRHFFWDIQESRTPGLIGLILNLLLQLIAIIDDWRKSYKLLILSF